MTPNRAAPLPPTKPRQSRIEPTARANRMGRAAEVTIGTAMGHLELFAQRTFAEETERITGAPPGGRTRPRSGWRRCKATASS